MDGKDLAILRLALESPRNVWCVAILVIEIIALMKKSIMFCSGLTFRPGVADNWFSSGLRFI